jgi:Peptidase S24-like
MTDVRTVLDQLIRDRGEDYASLSRLLGRNAAYIQQFIRRGTPKKLDEEDRRTLARYFRVDEGVLGGPRTPVIARADSRRGADFVRIPRLAIGASAGPGTLDEDDRAASDFILDARSVRGLGNAGLLSMIKVSGDSMDPTLGDGDDILVDRSDAADRVRDGIYVLRFDGALNVKRIALNPEGRRFTVRSDNAAYPSWPDCDPTRIDIIGRVVWVGRRVR